VAASSLPSLSYEPRRDSKMRTAAGSPCTVTGYLILFDLSQKRYQSDKQREEDKHRFPPFIITLQHFSKISYKYKRGEKAIPLTDRGRLYVCFL
jgi:hypothetical protein